MSNKTEEIPLAALGAAAGAGIALANLKPAEYGADVLWSVFYGAVSGALLQWAAPRVDGLTIGIMAMTGIAAFSLTKVANNTSTVTTGATAGG